MHNLLLRGPLAPIDMDLAGSGNASYALKTAYRLTAMRRFFSLSFH
jgi:hypothetical protein